MIKIEIICLKKVRINYNKIIIIIINNNNNNLEISYEITT